MGSKWEREIGRRSRRGKGKQNGGKRREEWGKREQAGLGLRKARAKQEGVGRVGHEGKRRGGKQAG